MSSGKPYVGAVVSLQRKAGVGAPEAAVVTNVNPGGSVDLHVFETTLSDVDLDSVSLIDFPAAPTPGAGPSSPPPANDPPPPPPKAKDVGNFE